MEVNKLRRDRDISGSTYNTDRNERKCKLRENTKKQMKKEGKQDIERESMKKRIESEAWK